MSPTMTDDVAAVRNVPQRIVDAWAANDAEAFAGVFTEDARLILPGDIFLKGREAIQSFMAAGYSGPYKGTRVYGDPVDMRQISDDVVLLVTRGGVLAPGETEVAPERTIRATWVIVKQGEDWLISAYQNTPVSAN
jgi:uncharacterized protein (TIGR02246 family)